jgi:uncharacterized protein YndB with AHSA1/START domain
MVGMRSFVFGILILSATPAAAEVVNASPNGFEVRQTINLVVPANIAFQSFADLPRWWDPEHTYSGKSSNLSLNLSPGGCFCERFPDGGGIEHMRVAYVEPGKRVILTGALGPLLYEATTGVMDVQVKTAAGGSQLTLDYRVAGFAAGGGDKLAPAVDQMLGEQMKRLRTYAAARPRT